MGFFSWKTQDTDRSIANNYSTRKTFTVVMIDNDVLCHFIVELILFVCIRLTF